MRDLFVGVGILVVDVVVGGIGRVVVVYWCIVGCGGGGIVVGVVVVV